MQYEVEVKSLLGSQERADALLAQLEEYGPMTLRFSNAQLTHYFEGGDIEELISVTAQLFSSAVHTKLIEILHKAVELSIRSREEEGRVYLIVKASVGSDSSANGVARLEFQESVPLSLSELDDTILRAGFSYQAKWSRERQEYMYGDIAICFDRNAGYGWMAEFEKVVDDESGVDGARAQVLALMEKCGLTELPQERLERMFDFYNTHWREYYGTDKVFTIL